MIKPIIDGVSDEMVNTSKPGVVWPLTLKAMNYFNKNLEDQRVYSIQNHHTCFIEVFMIHLNTYVMGLRPLEICLLLQCGDRL